MQSSEPPKDASDSVNPTPSALRIALSIGFFIALWTSWIIFLSGTAAGQVACEDTLDAAKAGRELLQTLPQQQQQAWYSARRMLSGSHESRHLLASTYTTCSTTYSLPWWEVWLQALNLILAMCAAASPSLRLNFGQPIVLLFVINTTLLMAQAYTLNSTIVDSDGSSNADKTRAASRAGLAGAIMLMIFNLLYILAASSRVEWLSPSLSLPSRGPATSVPMSTLGPENSTTTSHKAPVPTTTTYSGPPPYTGPNGPPHSVPDPYSGQGRTPAPTTPDYSGAQHTGPVYSGPYSGQAPAPVAGSPSDAYGSQAHVMPLPK